MAPDPEDEALPEATRAHLDAIRRHYEKTGPELLWPARKYREWIAHYCNLLIPPGSSVLEIGCGAGDLLARLKTRDIAGIDISERQLQTARRRVPHGEFHLQAGEELELSRVFDVIVISDTLNLAADVQQLFERLHRVSSPETRLVINVASSLWKPAFLLATVLRLRTPQPLCSWLAPSDVTNLLRLSDWEPIRMSPRILLPFGAFGVDVLANRWLAPLLPWLCLTTFCVARPSARPRQGPLTVSLVVPARNEAGNIEELVRRTPQIGVGTEIIFVEGHSTDSTWQEIQRVKAANPGSPIKAFQQAGRGKGDAVRLGFSHAIGDLLIILDCDLTVSPEELSKFYRVIASGRAEFANGVRLVYPAGKEMRFLNLCANTMFSFLFSWLLGQPVKDTLCGTKALRREDWHRISANRKYFGEFDPFGDFDLLFGADKLNLKIADVPVRYHERIYGTTNINRWRDGTVLVRMVIFAARKLKFV